jgi:hypothetical protein
MTKFNICRGCTALDMHIDKQNMQSECINNLSLSRKINESKVYCSLFNGIVQHIYISKLHGSLRSETDTNTNMCTCVNQ